MLNHLFYLLSGQRLRRPHLQSGPRLAGGRDRESESDGADDYGWGDFAAEEDVMGGRGPLRGVYLSKREQRGKKGRRAGVAVYVSKEYKHI